MAEIVNMNPISFTVKDGVTHFHYKLSDLIPFVRRGKTHGDSGLIVVRREGNTIVYRGFGTIESPVTYIVTLSLMHHPIMDGRMLTDEERVNPVPKEINMSNFSFEIFDLSKNQHGNSNQRMFI